MMVGMKYYSPYLKKKCEVTGFIEDKHWFFRIKDDDVVMKSNMKFSHFVETNNILSEEEYNE